MNGHLHPLTQFNRLSLKYFRDLGFDILEGKEIESEWWNFDAVNVPADHPSRDIQDTFWLAANKDTSEVADLSREALAKREGLLRGGDGYIGGGNVLRTHTTGSEMSIVKNLNIRPPFAIVVPGRCYRNERTDLKHEHTFYQIDGIICDEKVNMTHLIGILEGWIHFTLGKDIKTRIRPSYFPFVEPGLEMDIKIAKSKELRAKNQSGWREMLGAGMAHPLVLKNMGIDPNKYQAAMWGPGIDRFAMIKYGVDDIRRFHSQDLRFLKQF